MGFPPGSTALHCKIPDDNLAPPLPAWPLAAHLSPRTLPSCRFPGLDQNFLLISPLVFFFFFFTETTIAFANPLCFLSFCSFLFCFCFSGFCFCFCFLRAAPAVYGSSQARDQIGATAAGLHHSHSNARSELHLQPTPQLMAMPDPRTTERSQGSNPHPHGY